MSNIKLEVGKSYRTKSGEKVDIILFERDRSCPFVAQYRDGCIGHYYEDGSYMRTSKSDLDIIAEWEDEPTEIDMTVSREYLESKPESILQEAERLINGDRREEYGDVKDSFNNIAAGWSVSFGKEVTGKQVALAMAWLKICRENNKSKRDNIVDIAGYAALIEKL